MTNGNGKNMDLIDHEIAIDEYVKVTLSIPKKLTAMELKGIMLKANQLLKLSEISIQSVQQRGSYKKRREGLGSVWKEGMLAELVGMIGSRGERTKASIFKEFANKYGMTEHDADKKYYYEQTCRRLPAGTTPKATRASHALGHKGSGKKIWTDEMVKLLKLRKKENKFIQDIVKEINEKFKVNLTQEQVKTKWGNIKSRGF